MTELDNFGFQKYHEVWAQLSMNAISLLCLMIVTSIVLLIIIIASQKIASCWNQGPQKTRDVEKGIYEILEKD